MKQSTIRVLDLNSHKKNLEKIEGLQLLNLKNFRNIKELELFFHPKLNFFYGENAQGKTSLLEAIYFLSELRSFRISEFSSLISHEETESFLSTQLYREEISHQIKIELSTSEKKVLLNEKVPRPYHRLRKLLPIVLFTPDSVRLFRSSPSQRRDYFDHLFGILSDVFLAKSVDYSKILKQKLRLIEDSKANFRNLTLSELEVWNERLAENGAEIIYRRFVFTKKLSAYLNQFFNDLSCAEWKMSFSYQPYLDLIDQTLSTEEIKIILLREMNRRFQEEIDRSQILVGPHRDDWSFLLNGVNLREEGSQGQHRVAVASTKLAEVELMRDEALSPIALFDDLLSELDEKRAITVLQVLEENKAQVFLTSVTPSVEILKKIEGKSFELLAGEAIYRS